MKSVRLFLGDDLKRRGRRAVIGAAVSLAAVLASAFLFLRRERVPQYQGKSIALWFQESAQRSLYFAGNNYFLLHAGNRVRLYRSATGAVIVGPVIGGDRYSAEEIKLERDRSLEPFRAMGTNAAFWLAHELVCDESGAAKVYWKFFQKLGP